MNTQIKLWHALLLTLVVSVIAVWGATLGGENKVLREALNQGGVEVRFNQSEAALQVPKPNLAPVNVQKVPPGGMTIAYVQNQGNKLAIGNAKNVFEYDFNSQSFQQTDQKVTEYYVYDMDPGDEVQVQTSVGNQIYIPPSAYPVMVRFCADTGNAIKESNEGDNCTVNGPFYN